MTQSPKENTENSETETQDAQTLPEHKRKKLQNKQEAKSRLSDALRANLRRRKDQSRARS